MLLEVTPTSVLQKELSTNRLLATYDYNDIDFVANVSDVPNGFVISNNGFNRLHLFQCEERTNFIESILKFAGEFIGISVRYRKDPITIDKFWTERFGKFRYFKKIFCLFIRNNNI